MKAFPFSYSIANRTHHDAGMDLRDYFAAKAMQGELASQSAESGYYEKLDVLADRAYQIADAMMEARGQE